MSIWNNKHVMITGIGSGIGCEIAYQALRGGAKVSGLYRNTLEMSFDEAQQSKHLLLCQGDISSERQVNKWVKQSIEFLPQVDVLIHCAGQMYYMDLSKPNSEQHAQMTGMVQANCMGFIHLISAILPTFLEQNSGQWINISSDAAKQPFPGLSIYSGTKAFLDSCCSGLRQELNHTRCRVTNIQPGNVRTTLHAKTTDSNARQAFGTEDKGQYLSSADIVASIEYVLSTPTHVAINELLIEPSSESL